jgi:hypothetical protein
VDITCEIPVRIPDLRSGEADIGTCIDSELN